jgi:hypothetical protein
MATTFTVTANVKCWKVHKCVDCGCEYRYRFERKVQGQGGTERAAYETANRNVEKAVENEVDVRPCPTCGRVQPDMVGQVKAKQHGWIGGGTIVPVAAVVVLGATYVLAGNLPAIIVAAVLAGAALLNFFIAVGNPNSDLAKNVAVSEGWIDAGTMEVTKEGDRSQLEPPPGPMGFPHWLGLGLGALAAVVALAPMIYQTMNNLPLNADTKPDVVSPGDEVKVYFPDRIDCVKSYWRSVSMADAFKNMNFKKDAAGKVIIDQNEMRRMEMVIQNLPYSPPKVTIANAADLGVPDLKVAAAAADATWGQSMSVKSREKHTHPWIWAKLTVPADDRLQDKTIEAEVAMDVLFPKAEGNQFFTEVQQVRKVVPLSLAKKGAGKTYATIWWAGLVLGGLMSVTASFYLRSLNKQLQRHAIKPQVEHDRDEDEAAAPPRAEDDPPPQPAE